MIRENVLSRLESLPFEAQKQVIVFLDFLEQQYKTTSPRKKKKSINFSQEQFIGIWKNRSDLMNSSAWVKKTRISEWEVKN